MRQFARLVGCQSARDGKRPFSIHAKVKGPSASLYSPTVDQKSKERLGSSARVIILPNDMTAAISGRNLPVISFVWKFPAGSKYENSSSIGVSHYLRHALFMVYSRVMIKYKNWSRAIRHSRD